MNTKAPAKHPKAPDSRVAAITPTPIDSLVLWDANPRFISPRDLDRLKLSLTSDPDMLYASPVVYQSGTRKVIFGNARTRAARDLGWDTIPAAAANLDDITATSWALRDNAHYGEWDDLKLRSLLSTIRPTNPDAFTGFHPDDLARLLPAPIPTHSPDPLGFLAGVTTDGASPWPEHGDLPTEANSGELTAFSVAVTPAQRSMIMGTVRRIRDAHPDLQSTADALTYLCTSWTA